MKDLVFGFHLLLVKLYVHSSYSEILVCTRTLKPRKFHKLTLWKCLQEKSVLVQAKYGSSCSHGSVELHVAKREREVHLYFASSVIDASPK